MANKLRFRFILTSMSSLLAVIFVIMLVINLANYAKVRSDADDLLAALDAEGGVFASTMAPPDEAQTPPDQGPRADRPPIDGGPNGHANFNAETPFETRYFTVSVAADGTYTTNLSQIAAVSNDEAVAMAQTALQRGKTGGYIGVYRYRIQEGGGMVLFVDCNRQLASADAFLRISLIVSAAAFLGTFLLVFLFSRRAVKPTVEAYERQRQFVTESSHELKTPITIISANNELLQLEYGENESTAAIEHQVKRLSAMVKNLVSLSRLDEAEHVVKTRLDLSECVEEHVDLYRTALTAAERDLTTDIDKGVCIQGDLDLVAQLVSVLLDNAIKYAATFTRISLKAGKAATLLVENDALHLADGDKTRCFERFYRDADVAEGIEGSGIGLAIVKQIVQLHGGTASASAKDGVFSVRITF